MTNALILVTRSKRRATVLAKETGLNVYRIVTCSPIIGFSVVYEVRA